jgi:hypothetical protein
VSDWLFPPPFQLWEPATKFDLRANALADKHYSRRKPGSGQFMPPGETIILVGLDNYPAVFGWWRPHPDSGIQNWNGLNGWTCTIFRNEGDLRSSDLIRDAETAITDCGPDGLLTYVWDARVKSVNPGYCFKQAGWRAIGRSADNRKTLLQKIVETP